jgi:hypothetical protein
MENLILEQPCWRGSLECLFGLPSCCSWASWLLGAWAAAEREREREREREINHVDSDEL